MFIGVLKDMIKLRLNQFFQFIKIDFYIFLIKLLEIIDSNWCFLIIENSNVFINLFVKIG